MRIGSLFTGIDGLALGLESVLPARTVWQVEKSPFCRRVLARHWPEALRYDDIEGLTGLAPVDLVCGGPPCQDNSSANRTGQGLAGPKSRLWFEMLRVVVEVRPWCVVYENVAGAIAKGGLDTVCAGLADEGFEVEATRIEASDVGAPHRRERVLVVATHPDRHCKPVVAIDAQVAELRRVARPLPAWGVGVRVDDGLPAGLDTARMRALGNAVMPRVGAIAGRRVLELMEER